MFKKFIIYGLLIFVTELVYISPAVVASPQVPFCNEMLRQIVATNPGREVQLVYSRKREIRGALIRFRTGVGVATSRRVTKTANNTGDGKGAWSEDSYPYVTAALGRLRDLPSGSQITVTLENKNGVPYVAFSERYDLSNSPMFATDPEAFVFGMGPFEYRFTAPIVFDAGSESDYHSGKQVRFRLTAEGEIEAARALQESSVAQEAGKKYGLDRQPLIVRRESPEFAAQNLIDEARLIFDMPQAAQEIGLIPSGTEGEREAEQLMDEAEAMTPNILAHLETSTHTWISEAPDRIPISFDGDINSLIMRFPQHISWRTEGLIFWPKGLGQ